METPLVLREFIARAWGSNDPERFPGPQPISIERRHFPLLLKQPYLVCEKTDGVRQMLVCLEKRCFLIDRAFHLEEIRACVPSDTIFDCERVDGLLLVYDAVMVKGESLLKKPLTERLAAAEKVIKSIIRMSKDQVTIRLKKMRPLAEVEHVLSASYPYETDGLIFTPINEPIRMGTHETMFKWKPRETITVDFLVRSTGDSIDRMGGKFETVYGMYIADRQRLVYIAHFNTIAGYKDLETFEDKVVECSYGDKGWNLVKVRQDKTHPNNVRTYERTLVNIREDIKPQEFREYIAV